ncbi:UNVERIFIED_ORG: hypothetical protein LHJ69_13030 [Shinella sp. XGS7]|nr:hypothetical protein [Shinella sp. XGS7]
MAGKTELTGAQITSTQAAIDQGKNRYEAQGGTTVTDLQNSARYSAQSASVGVAAGTPAPGKSLSAGLSGVGIGSDIGSDTGSTTAHVRGSNPGNTPYISTTDANAATETPKYYGSQQTTVSARDLQRDINSGVASQDIQIVTNQKLVQNLQAKVDSAQAKFDANPSPANERELERTIKDLDNARRDGECLIKGGASPRHTSPLPPGLSRPSYPCPKHRSSPPLHRRCHRPRHRPLPSSRVVNVG